MRNAAGVFSFEPSSYIWGANIDRFRLTHSACSNEQQQNTSSKPSVYGHALIASTTAVWHIFHIHIFSISRRLSHFALRMAANNMYIHTYVPTTARYASLICAENTAVATTYLTAINWPNRRRCLGSCKSVCKLCVTGAPAQPKWGRYHHVRFAPPRLRSLTLWCNVRRIDAENVSMVGRLPKNQIRNMFYWCVVCLDDGYNAKAALVRFVQFALLLASSLHNIQQHARAHVSHLRLPRAASLHIMTAT